jgi:hypothetical protein
MSLAKRLFRKVTLELVAFVHGARAQLEGVECAHTR